MPKKTPDNIKLPRVLFINNRATSWQFPPANGTDSNRSPWSGDINSLLENTATATKAPIVVNKSRDIDFPLLLEESQTVLEPTIITTASERTNTAVAIVQAS